MVGEGPHEPDESPDATRPDGEPGNGDLGNTVERPPADPWAGETEIRPPLSDLPPSQPQRPTQPQSPTQIQPPDGPNVGPGGTGVLPTLPDEPAKWSAR